jgi:hypothetical protein
MSERLNPSENLYLRFVCKAAADKIDELQTHKDQIEAKLEEMQKTALMHKFPPFEITCDYCGGVKYEQDIGAQLIMVNEQACYPAKPCRWCKGSGIRYPCKKCLDTGVFINSYTMVKNCSDCKRRVNLRTYYEKQENTKSLSTLINQVDCMETK